MKKPFLKKLILLCLLGCFAQISFAQSSAMMGIPSNSDFAKLESDYATYFDANGELIDSTARRANKLRRSLTFWQNRTSTGNFQDYGKAVLESWQNDEVCDHFDHPNYPENETTKWSHIPIESGPTALSTTSTVPAGSRFAGGTGAVISQWIHPTNPDIIYIGGFSSGLWRTIDGGDNWDNLTDDAGLPAHGVTSISVNPNSLDQIIISMRQTRFDKQYNIGVFKTVNAGVDWTFVNDLYDSNDHVGITDIKRFPDNTNRLIASSRNKIYLSTNNGVNFTEVASATLCNSNEKSRGFRQIMFDTFHTDSNGDIQIVYVSGSEFWRSDDRGNTYINLTSNQTRNCAYYYNSSIDLLPAANPSLNPSTIYRMTVYSEPNGNTTIEKRDFDYSNDKGLTWTYKYRFNNVNATNIICNVLALNDNLFYTGRIIIYSNENNVNPGSTTPKRKPVAGPVLSDIQLGKYIHDDIRAFNKVKVGTEWYLYAATDGGLFKSEDLGKHWEFLNPQVDLSEILEMDTHSSSNEIYLAYQDMSWSTYNKKANSWETALAYADGFQVQSSRSDEDLYYLKNQYGGAHVYDEGNLLYISDFSDELGGGGDNFYTGSSPDFKNTSRIYVANDNIISFDLESYAVEHIADYNEASGNVNQNRACLALANANSNPDVLYTTWKYVAGVDDPLDYLSNIIKGTKQSDGSYIWEDISVYNTLDETIWKLPSAIAVHSDDENIVMVGMNADNVTTSSIGDIIYLSTDGGTTWENKSYGLPSKFGVNDITFQKGTDMRFYAATDTGIYYFDPNHSEDGNIGKWKCFNYGLTNAIVNSIRFDYCENKLYAALLGRGLWQAPIMPADPNPTATIDTYETIISTSQTWDFYKQSANDIRIESGATLTLKGELAMSENKRIYVEKGGKLIVDGGHIYSACGTTWRGIHIEGDDALSQGSPGSPIQGYVYMNNATIENALRGVRLIGESSSGGLAWGTAGGWIRADDSQFINCRKAVEFWKYDQLNKSRFNHCTFETNTDYPFSEAPEHITMWGVDGVKYEGCAFSTIPDFNDALTHRAIYAVDANFSVKADINDNRSSFTGFDKAIDVDNSASCFTLTVDESDFSGNNRAMTLSNVMAPTITRNRINMSSTNGNYPMGIALYNCYQYQIEGNEIDGSANYPNPNVPDPKDISPLKQATTGIYTNHTSSEEYNEIYKNDISGCFWGVYAHGDHQDSNDGNIGLELLCNDMGTTSELITSPYPNAWDVYVYGKMSRKQGIFPSTTGIDPIQKPAGNRFDDATAYNSEGNFDIVNSDFDVENYFHHETNETDPQEVNANEVFKFEYTGVPFLLNNRNLACPTNISNGNTHGFPYSYNDKFNDINGKRSELTYLETNYTNTIDNGITSQLLDYLTDFTTPDDQILDYMVAGSPYLSDQVMIGAIQRNPPFDQWDLAEILIWNAPLSQNVIQAIGQSQPFTPYLYNLVVDQTGTSQRTLLDAEITALKQEIQQAEALYVSHALNEPDLSNRYQKIVDLHLNQNSVRSKQLLLWAYLQQNDLPAASSIISAHSNEDFIAVAELQHTVLSRGDKLNELNAAELSTLHTIATDEAHAAYMEARALLKLNDALTYDDPLPVIYTEPAPRKAQTMAPYKGKDLMKIQPNPIQNEAIVKAPLPKEFTSAELFIYRIDGGLQEIIDLHSSFGFTQIQVSNWKAGTYIAELQIDKKSIEQQKFTVIH